MKPLFMKTDAIVVRVPSLEDGLAFYKDKLGHSLIWRNDKMAALRMADSDTEFILSTNLDPETDILVESVDNAVSQIKAAGGSTILEPEDLPVGRVAVVKDPFGNVLTLVDLSKGHYKTDEAGTVVSVEANSSKRPQPRPATKKIQS